MFGFKALFGFNDNFHTLESRINPANGLPMVDGTEIDVAGNPYGTDSNSSFDSSFGTSFGTCGWDD